MKVRTTQLKFPGGIDVTRLSGVSTFAPSWAILSPALDLRRKGLETESSWSQYRQDYLKEMWSSWEREPLVWLELLSREYVTLKCYCERIYLPRCHRILLAEFLVERARELDIEAEYLGEVVLGWNIYSRSRDGQGLAAALTNPTVLSRKHGAITQDFPISFRGQSYPDVERPYLKLGKLCSSDQERDELMIELIVLKFKMYPWLFFAILEMGGIPFLETCTHFTYARTEAFRSWEGYGRESRFIRNLIEAYRRAEEVICSPRFDVEQL
jgi:uncharacterized protein YeaO (DUF488 family)